MTNPRISQDYGGLMIESTIKAYQKKYKLVSIENIEFRPKKESSKAHCDMDEFEKILSDIKFSCIEPRTVWWLESKYIKIMDKSGRYVTIDAYFNGSRETIRSYHSVNYNISGLEEDVLPVINKIHMQSRNKAYSCR